MFGLGLPELLVVLVLALLVFGAGKLPEVGAGLGRALRAFKKGVSEPDAMDVPPPPLSHSASENKEKKKFDVGSFL